MLSLFFKRMCVFNTQNHRTDCAVHIFFARHARPLYIGNFSTEGRPLDSEVKVLLKNERVPWQTCIPVLLSNLLAMSIHIFVCYDVVTENVDVLTMHV